MASYPGEKEVLLSAAFDKRGKVRTLHLKDQVMEKSIAVDGTTAYILTGPAGRADHANAKGHLYAVAFGKGDSPEVLWRQEYEAGDVTTPTSRSAYVSTGSSPPVDTYADLAAKGEYVWYLQATGFRTGKTVWKRRLGAGGSCNDATMAGTLGTDGTFYGAVVGGVVAVRGSRPAR